MLYRLRRHLTFANSISLVALFVALGGTSYAVATNSIDSREIKNNAISSKDIRNNQVASKDVRNGSLVARDFKRGQLTAGPRGATGARGPQGVAGPAGPANVVYGRGDAEATTPVPLLGFPGLGVTVSTDGNADNTATVLIRNTRTTGDLKATRLDPDPTDSSGVTFAPGTVGLMGGPSALELMITSAETAGALHLVCKVNNHGGGDGNIHCIGTKSGP